MISHWKCYLLVINIIPLLNTVIAGELSIEGDIKTLLNIESRYNIKIVGGPQEMIPIYKYIFDMPITSDYYIHDEFFYGTKNIDWNQNFTSSKITPGSYVLTVQAYYFPFRNTIYGWKIAETQIPIEIRDSLNDFISIVGTQDTSSPRSKDMFVIKKPINFSLAIDPKSILARNSNKLDYHWELIGPDINKTEFTGSNFQEVFNSTSDYTLNLKLTAIVDDQLTKNGTATFIIQIRQAIENVTIHGNTFVENGSLLHLNIICNGSSNFIFCHTFGSVKSNESCFSSGKILNACNYSITHYFPENGTKYVNIGIQNDVSFVFRNAKITIYKVGPKPSFAFVIIPLISIMLAIAIAVVGITHYIRQYRQMNSTIEVATIENFGLYDDDENLLEKTFCRRVKDSFIEVFNK